MRQNKLAKHITILQLLEKNNKMTFDEFLLTTEYAREILEELLESLVKKSLTTKQVNTDERVIFRSTKQGTNILRFFNLNAPISIF